MVGCRGWTLKHDWRQSRKHCRGCYSHSLERYSSIATQTNASVRYVCIKAQLCTLNLLIHVRISFVPPLLPFIVTIFASIRCRFCRLVNWTMNMPSPCCWCYLLKLPLRNCRAFASRASAATPELLWVVTTCALYNVKPQLEIESRLYTSTLIISIQGSNVWR